MELITIDVKGIVIQIAILTLTITALVKLWKTEGKLSRKIAWTAFILIVIIIGPIVYLWKARNNDGG